MRVLTVAVVLGILQVGPALAFPGLGRQPCDDPPPQSAQQPVTDPVLTFTIPNEKLAARCNFGPIVVFGCTFLATAKHPAIIFLNSDLTPVERACTLLYEKAHLPPNNWQDPVMERAISNTK